MQTRHLNTLLIVAIWLISTAPLYAQAQPDPAQLKADAQKIISNIKSDKAKTNTYCEIESLAPEIERAAQEKDTKKFQALTQKANELEKQLGPDYVALFDALDQADTNSADVREILSMFNGLDQSCPH